jgi:hypothetical protein
LALAVLVLAAQIAAQTDKTQFYLVQELQHKLQLAVVVVVLMLQALTQTVKVVAPAVAWVNIAKTDTKAALVNLVKAIAVRQQQLQM